MVGPASQWRYGHNYRHHVFTNVIGMDEDLGFGVIRVSRDQEWKPGYLFGPLRTLLLALVFEWGIALHDLAAEQNDQPTEEGKQELKRVMLGKMGRQAAKDYLFYPALSGRRFVRTFLANLVAAGFRNAWAYIVIVVRPLRRRRREIHSRSREERDEGGVVPAADAGNRERRRRARPGVHEWTPVLPDRASPVPGSAKQQAPRDLIARARAHGRIRPALYDGSLDSTVLAHRPHDLDALRTGSLPDRHVPRRAGDGIRGEVQGYGTATKSLWRARSSVPHDAGWTPRSSTAPGCG